jgi:hypothetical protein
MTAARSAEFSSSVAVTVIGFEACLRALGLRLAADDRPQKRNVVFLGAQPLRCRTHDHARAAPAIAVFDLDVAGPFQGLDMRSEIAVARLRHSFQPGKIKLLPAVISGVERRHDA